MEKVDDESEIEPVPDTVADWVGEVVAELCEDLVCDEDAVSEPDGVGESDAHAEEVADGVCERLGSEGRLEGESVLFREAVKALVGEEQADAVVVAVAVESAELERVIDGEEEDEGEAVNDDVLQTEPVSDVDGRAEGEKNDERDTVAVTEGEADAVRVIRAEREGHDGELAAERVAETLPDVLGMADGDDEDEGVMCAVTEKAAEALELLDGSAEIEDTVEADEDGELFEEAEAASVSLLLLEARAEADRAALADCAFEWGADAVGVAHCEEESEVAAVRVS
jgi:hypothetical protein